VWHLTVSPGNTLPKARHKIQLTQIF